MKIQWPQWKTLWQRNRVLLLAIGVGALLLLLPSEGGEQTRRVEETGQSASFDLEGFEQRLSQVLSQVAGAGEVQVLLTLNGSGRTILAQDLERDGERSSVSHVTVGQGSGNQEPVALQTMAPEFRGALVVCPGGEDPRVCLALIQAVSALTGLGADRITVCAGGI